MTISSYADLLAAARAQVQPQRLLFAFARAELPNDAGVAERERFAASTGGTLAPVMAVDKAVDELGSFAALVDESRQTGAHWDIVFVTTLSGRDGQQPLPAEVEAPLEEMLASIRNGQIDRFLAFDRAGELLRFH